MLKLSRNISFTAGALLLLSAAALGQARNDRSQMGLKGPVKAVRDVRVVETLTDGQWVAGPRQIDFDITLDAEGRKAVMQSFGAGGVPQGKSVYTYASESSWTEARYGADGKLKDTVEYTEQFDPASKSSKLTVYSIKDQLGIETVKKYDAQGRVVEMLGYDRHNTLRTRGVNRFGEGDTPEEFLLYNDDILRHKSLRTAEGTEVYLYNADGTLRSRTVSKKPIEMELDAHGNWTRKVSSSTVHESGRVREVRQVTYRSITYF